MIAAILYVMRSLMGNQWTEWSSASIEDEEVGDVGWSTRRARLFSYLYPLHS